MINKSISWRINVYSDKKTKLHRAITLFHEVHNEATHFNQYKHICLSWNSDRLKMLLAIDSTTDCNF